MRNAEAAYKEDFCFDATEDKGESSSVPLTCLSFLRPNNFRSFQIVVFNFFVFENFNKSRV